LFSIKVGLVCYLENDVHQSILLLARLLATWSDFGVREEHLYVLINVFNQLLTANFGYVFSSEMTN